MYIKFYDKKYVKMKYFKDMNRGSQTLSYSAMVHRCGTDVVTQRPRVRSHVGTSFLGEDLIGVFPHL